MKATCNEWDKENDRNMKLEINRDEIWTTWKLEKRNQTIATKDESQRNLKTKSEENDRKMKARMPGMMKSKDKHNEWYKLRDWIISKN